ncbi:hypothetical protein EKO27_g11414 [Xylaria grammica]|uniref:Uncharacterized protein n=1 Tax=Xylaria grammica TaxID=363999 RepID=A0A439CNN4_9PEZI|nr:hypothetical protein EKO27_g11414 [Xylaria grammica]
MDQQANNEQELPVRGRGRPRKQLNGKPGRPFKTPGAVRGRYQVCGQRAPRTKVVQPPTTVRTRLRTGYLDRKDYRIRPRRRPRRRQDEADEESDKEEDRATDDAPSPEDDVSVDSTKSERELRGRSLFNLMRRRDDGAITISSDPDSDSSLADPVLPGRPGKRPAKEISSSGSEGPARRLSKRQVLAEDFPPLQDGDRPTASFEEEYTLLRLEIGRVFLSSGAYLNPANLRGTYWTEDIEEKFNGL